MAPTTAAERMRQYRARLKADPERREKYLQSERQRWRKNVEEEKKKGINDLSERAQRQKRKMWRAAYKRSKEKREALRNLTTPPHTPEQSIQPGSSRQRLVARKKYRKQKNKLKKKIEQLEEKLEKQRKQKEKYKKRCQRLKKHSDSPRSKVNELTANCPVNPRIRKTLLYHQSLITDIRHKYQQTTSERERQLIAKVIRGKIIKKYRLQRFAEDSLGFSSKRWQHTESLHFERKKVNRFTAEFKNRVKTFYERDDVSRITTGTKQTLTRNKIKMQKRFLVDTLKNLHRRFLSEHSGENISYSLFCHLRPFWVGNPTISERDTCMCKLHENLSFVAERLNQLKVIETINLENLVEKVCCNSSNKGCMYGECVHCKDKSVPLSSSLKLTASVSFTQWVTEEKKMDKKKEGEERSSVKVTVKKSVESTQKELVELFHTYLQRFKPHQFNIKQQYAFCRELKNNMSREEALIHIDFSENYSCKYSSQIQAVHFGASHQQATLHTGVLYMGGKEPVCFCTISPSREKSPPAIWQHLAPVLDYLQATHPQVSMLHFFSDGPCTQYRQRGNFFLFSTELYRRRFKAGSWNFFEAGHGKGAPDGVGGALKRTADTMVAKGRDIPDANELFKALSETNTTVKLFFVKSEDVNNAMAKMPNQIPAVPGTMKIHQVITLARGELKHRDVSCMCLIQKHFNCDCFNTQCFSFGIPQPASGGNPHPQPASGGNPHPASGGNPHPQPASGGNPHPASGGNPHPQPARGGIPQPASGGNPHPQPTSGGNPHPQPARGGNPHPQPASGGIPQPASGGNPHPQPASGGNPHPQPASGGNPHPQPASGGNPHPQPARGGIPQPASGGNPHPQPARGGNPQPASGGNPHPQTASPLAENGIQWGNPELIGQWCILTYENDLYPGIILSTDEKHVQVKCMSRIGPNRFFWPTRDDILWYPFDDVLEVIPPPQPVTQRHVQVLKEVWDRLSV